MSDSKQFDLTKFDLNSDGSYSKKKTNQQPRDIKLIDKGNKTIVRIEKLTGDKVDYKKQPATFWKFQNIQDIFNDANANGYIFIPNNVPSLKNSKQIFKNGKTGKNFITSSELCKSYVRSTEMFYEAFREKFLEMVAGKEKPYRVQFFFIRDKDNSWDYSNICQICLDCMTAVAFYPMTKDKLVNAQRKLQREKARWIEDDNSKNIIPNFDKGYAIDKNVPGVIITVL